MAMKFQQGDYVVENISPRAAPVGEHRTGLNVVMPPELQALVGKTVTRQQLEDMGARSEGDNMVVTYGDQDWVLQLSGG